MKKIYLVIFNDHVHLELLGSVGNFLNLVFSSPNQTVELDFLSDLLGDSFKEVNVFSLVDLDIEDDDGLSNNDLLGLSSNSGSLLGFSGSLGLSSFLFVVISEKINIVFSGRLLLSSRGLLLGLLLLLLLSTLLLSLLLSLLGSSPLSSDVGGKGSNDQIPEVDFRVLVSVGKGYGYFECSHS